MKKIIVASVVSVLLLSSCSSVQTVTKSLKADYSEPKNAKRHTPQKLYVNAIGTQEMMKKDKNVILVDVRTPEEWHFVGYTKSAQIMIPGTFFDYSQMDTVQNKPRYMPVSNTKWISTFEEKIADLGYDENNTYIIMCRSGATRAAPVAKIMDQYGYKKVYIMTDGFEGGKVKEGAKKGFRLKNGWKNSGSSWTYKIDPKKVYFKKYGVSL